MELSAKGAAFLRLQEGFVDHWYLDAVKVPTIGIGFTWRSAAFRKWWGANRPGQAFARGATMSRQDAEQVLILLCAEEYGHAVNAFLGGRAVDQNVFDGVTSPVYNCGAGALAWDWADLIKAGKIDAGARKLETTAVTARGKRLAGLVRRRHEESILIRTGFYTGVVGAPAPSAPPDATADGVLTRGERGAAVASLIRDLHRLGYYGGVLDDVFGRGTEAAVLKFQRAHRLKDDGAAGPKTLAAIKAAL